MTNGKINKIVLAYSGGLDTSVMLRWLRDKYQCEVVCYCADVGQGAEMDGLEEKAKATGGSKLYIEDLREEFVRDYVWTSVKANAVYEGVYLMGTSLARPVIAKRQIEIRSDKYQCEVVCYCADVGQGAEMDGLEEKAKATGGSKLYIEDLREEFVRDYVWTSVKANAVYEGVYLMGTSLARPVIAKRQIEI